MKICPFEDAGYNPENDKEDTELRTQFQGGRLDVLCQLVVDGKLTLEEALPYSGMVQEELKAEEEWDCCPASMGCLQGSKVHKF